MSGGKKKKSSLPHLFLVIGICIVVFFGAAAAPKDSTAPVLVTPPITPDGRPPQFVILAFDGSSSLEMWQETRDFAKQMGFLNKPVFFTYFISATYLLPKDRKTEYRPPEAPAGTSLIGFGNDAEDVRKRIEQINSATAEGHEIASHAVGHFNGANWSLASWDQELTSFENFLPATLTSKDIVGFRAPQLGANDAMDQALAKHGYRYDASRITLGNDWPRKNSVGLWEFPLATIGLPQGQTISMDYSIFALQSGAKNNFYRGDWGWEKSYQELLESYKKYFNHHYYGNRAPLFIGNHFSKWNDGLYWEVMKDFALEVCGLPDVRCTTHRALADYLDSVDNHERADQKPEWRENPSLQFTPRQIGEPMGNQIEQH